MYKEKLNEYSKSVKNSFDKVDDLRIETQFESLKDWSELYNLEEVRNWFLSEQKRSKLSVQDIPLTQCRGWHFNEDDGTIRHESGDFFYVQGVRVSMTEEREVGDGGWDQPIITQVGYDGGILGILRSKFNDIPYYLVEAKAEPGNPDKIQISPTLQATFSNLKRSHGGRKPRFSNYFENPKENSANVLFEQWMSEDGGRLHLKRNKGMLVEIENGQEIKIPQSFIWLTLYQIKELIKQESWVNPHIRGIISHL